jgi:hypothetical protein
MFPGIDSFAGARVGLCDDTVWCAEVARTGADTLVIALTSREARRILFMTDSSATYAEHALSNPDVEFALREFWTGVEARAGTTLYRPRSIENRAMWMNRGGWVGACAGGTAGSWLGVEYVGQSGGCLSYSIYRLNPPLFWGTACGATAAGSCAGFMIGDRMDRRPQPPVYVREPTQNRWVFGAIGAIAGLAVGSSFFVMNGSTLFGRIDWWGEIENDENRWSMIPALVAGAGIAVDLTYLGYLAGRDMDRRQAERKAREREERLSRLLPLPPGP